MSCNSRSTFQGNADLFLPKWNLHLDVSSFIFSLTFEPTAQMTFWLFFSLAVRRLQVQWLQTSTVCAGCTSPRFISVCCPCACQATGIVICSSAVTSTQSAGSTHVGFGFTWPEPVCSGSFRIRTFQHYLQNMIEKKFAWYVYIWNVWRVLKKDLTLVRLFAINDLTAEVVRCSFVLWCNIFSNPWTCSLFKYKWKFWHVSMTLYSCRGYYKIIKQKNSHRDLKNTVV